jgi:hypothetical protein
LISRRLLINIIAIIGVSLIFISGITLLLFGFRYWEVSKEVLKRILVLNEKIPQDILKSIPILALATGFLHIFLASIHLYSYVKILKSGNKLWRWISIAFSVIGIITLAGGVLGSLLILIFMMLYNR